MGLSSTPLPSSIPHSQVDSQVDHATNVCSDDDEDTLRRVMRSFGTKSFYLGDAGHGGDSESCSDDECSTNDDITYLQRLQEQFLPASAVASASSVPDTPPIVNPTRAFPPPDTDDDDDFQTLHAIQRRFACYGGGATINDFSPETCSAVSVELSEEDPHNLFSTLMVYEAGNESTNKSIDAPIVVPPITSLMNTETYRDFPDHNHKYNEDGLCSISARQFISSKFPKSVQNFVDALKKNRSYQRFIRAKLVEIEAKMEVNRKLKERIKCFMDFRTAYRRKLGSGLYQKRDPRVRLISLRKERSSRTVKDNSNNSSAVYFSPEENPQVSNYKMVMRRFPVSHRERQWSNAEKGEILKGVKQQYQEILFLNCMNLGSDFNGSIDSIIKSTIDNANQQATPELLRSFLPLVNWDRLASMYLPSRSGPSCQSRFLNHEDPMINHNPWTLSEDKKLLFIVQERGLYNWIEIAVTLRTNRTPFQCLARYQRSLNPHILNREWTKEEDTKLYATVETFGDNNWQIVASHLDGRTSNQCSIRWRNSLLPERKRVGRWSVEEDKRLKVSVILFGAKNWKKIAQFVPGRTQIQCRERWLNCLDPSLNLEGWTEEEDSNLLSAIAEHGHSWSKVATHIPGRTDNHCRRRWKSLLPHEVPKLKAAQQLKRTVLISNFVGRESERPALGPNDFTPIMSLITPNMENFAKVRKKRSREQSKPTNKMKASRKKQSRKSRAIIEKDGEIKSTEGLVRKKQSRKSRAIIEKDGEKKSTEGLVITAEENLREDLVVTADNLPLETFTPIVSEISRNKRPRKRIKEKNNTESLELSRKEMTKEIQ